MKHTLWAGILILILSISLIGCGPVTPVNTFAGTWTTNLGMMNFVQNEDQLIGNIEGYGGFWNETFTGNINENGEAVFETEVLGGFTLTLTTETTFESTSPDLSFCGVHGVNMELPVGCGFSGKWIATSKYLKNEGYLVLTQIGPDVTGDIYNAMGEKYETFKGTVEWGKGWRANGITIQRGELSLHINAVETGFELVYGESGNPQQICAVREGIESAYLSYFTCEP